VKSLPLSRKKALERWLDTDEDDMKVKRIKENIKLLLYNSENIAICNKEINVGNSKSVKKIKNAYL
jgi:hypothetical protein